MWSRPIVESSRFCSTSQPRITNKSTPKAKDRTRGFVTYRDKHEHLSASTGEAHGKSLPPTSEAGRDEACTQVSGVSSEVLATLQRYKMHNTSVAEATQNVRSWDTLMAMVEDPQVAAGQPSKPIELYGFLTSQRSAGSKSKRVNFFQLVDPHMRKGIQLVVSDTTGERGSQGGVQAPDIEEADHPLRSSSSDALIPRKLRPHTPVKVTGSVVYRQDATPITADTKLADLVSIRADPYVGSIRQLSHLEMRVDKITTLNTFPETLVAKADTNFPPEQRHLQLRTDSDLRYRLRARSMVLAKCRQFLFTGGFDEIETPLLFKSTPEGAQEFIVPTRKPGMAYALPQSPQQHKQLLMASGVSRYFQFARCFRDEDMRADRQPEFTQLDMELSFATASDVMTVIEYLLAGVVWPSVKRPTAYSDRMKREKWPFRVLPPDGGARLFPVMSYYEAMSAYGSDKPDLRLESQIKRVDKIIPDSLKAMLTSLDQPIVEMFKLPMGGLHPKESGKFMTSFLDAPSSLSYLNNPAGPPGVTVYDTTKPLNGLASFGHDAAALVENMYEPEIGDILIIQARPDVPFSGGSTPLGNIRSGIYQAALDQAILVGGMDAFLWVVDFPLFSPTVDTEPGQGGSAGICSTHHPFTAPRADQDLTKLYTDPLSVIGDHYDLVINGVEIGGGSQRIHDAAMQELIFRDILKMAPEKVEDFRHLLNALEAGCPPHAGIALGFDRLMALLMRRASVKDVIAFPKTGAGEDKLVGAPAKLTNEQLSTYHLAIKPDGQPQPVSPVSLKA